jgi:IS5 family transposase
MEILATQLRMRPALPEVIGNVDYQREKDLLIRIDKILIASGIEKTFVTQSVEKWKDEEIQGAVSAEMERRRVTLSSVALRCMITMDVLGESYRTMSKRLAECPLFQWFCGLDELGVVKVPAKSSLHRFHAWNDVGTLKDLNRDLLALASGHPDEDAIQALELKNAVELDTIWMDSTAVKANIHFPVDWVLLRDGTLTLMLATKLIREHGLKHRMKDPRFFLKQMNVLCMAMSATRRRGDVKRQRKRVLRQMKRLVKTVRNHALKHRDLLDREWEQTDWTRKQVDQILGRMDNVLIQLPKAIEQAHDRIIRGCPPENSEKILSLYEPDVQVIVRGKANAEVEFGNSLLIAEQADGLIVDWDFHKSSAPGDSKQLTPCLERISKNHGEQTVRAVSGDRQFDSAANVRWLEEKNIYNALCPRDPKKLEKKKHAAKFQELQKRRAQTEARIAILKGGFIGDSMRQRGFKNRERSVGWGVLTHNLWVLARLELADEHPCSLSEAA